VEAKAGGTYLPENTTWAKQTVAHNTLVVNETSDFGGNWKRGEALAPTPLIFDVSGNTQIASARMEGAWDGVTYTRTQALLSDPELGLPVVIDLLRVQGRKAARYDLPLHFNGQIMTVGFEAAANVAERPVLGKANGYQHLWVDATSAPARETRSLSWLLSGRFYTYRFGSDVPSSAILAESGANDPLFNLRREPALIQRVDGQKDATFFGVLEPHGEYNGTAEYVRGAESQISSVDHYRGNDADVVVLTLASGRPLALGVADDPAPTVEHAVSANGKEYRWKGAYMRFDNDAGRSAP
jgi:hypothetical protein